MNHDMEDLGLGLALDKELKIRKRVLSIFNKDHDDFCSKAELDDYLEEVEDIIWRLANNVDVDKAEAHLRKYRMENQALINAKNAKKAAAAAPAAIAPAINSSASAAAIKTGAAAMGPAAYLAGGVLPRLLPESAVLLDAGRNIKYDWSRQQARAEAEAAAAGGGWSSGIAHARYRQEALASLLACG